MSDPILPPSTPSGSRHPVAGLLLIALAAVLVIACGIG